MRNDFKISVGSKDAGERFYGNSFFLVNDYLGGGLRKHGVVPGMHLEYDNIGGIIGRTCVQTDLGEIEVLYRKQSGTVEVSKLKDDCNLKLVMPYDWTKFNKKLPVERVTRVMGTKRTVDILYGALALALAEHDFERGTQVCDRDMLRNNCGFGRMEKNILVLDKENNPRIDLLFAEKAWYEGVNISHVELTELGQNTNTPTYTFTSANVAKEKLVATTHIVDKEALEAGEITRTILTGNHAAFFNQLEITPAEINPRGMYPSTRIKVGDISSLKGNYWRSDDGISLVFLNYMMPKGDGRHIHSMPPLDLNLLE